jgi:LacI family transcriptional regulator
MVTRAQVAEHAGVSPAVVSYVLNDGPRAVAPATRARVLASVNALGYRPNAVARSLRVRRTHTIGLIVPDNSNPFFAELAREVEAAASARGYALLLGNSTQDAEREASYVETFRQRQVDGLLLIGVHVLPETVQGARTPIVVLDRPVPGLELPSVLIDHRGAALTGTRHLIAHGYERVGCIAGPDGVPVSDERSAGWRAALAEAGIGAEGELEVAAPFSYAGGYAAARRLLAATRPPRAIFASSDLQGIGALRAAADLGLRVPDDFALLSMDGTEQASFTTPGLSTVRQPLDQLAERAVQRLFAQLEAPAVEPTRDVLPSALVLRGSCGCPEPPAMLDE